MKEISIKRNIVMNALLTVSSLVFPLITFPYVSRALTPEGTGKVSLALSVISYFNLFAKLGIPVYGVRACAKVRDDRKALTKTAQELMIISMVMDVLAYLALFGAIAFVPKLREEKTLYLVISTTIILNSIGIEWLYKALEKYTYIAVRSVVFKVIALVGMFLLIHKQKDYVIYGALSVVASSASYVLNLVNAGKYIDWKPAGHYSFRKHMKPMLIFFAMSCATTIYGHMDTVMLGFIRNDVEVGYYSAAVKVKSILVAIVTSLGGALLPRLSFYIEQGKDEEFRRLTNKAFRFVCVVAVPLMIYFMLFCRETILVMSGAEYEGAILPTAVIMPTLLLIGLSNITGIQILVPLGKEKAVLYSEIGGAVVNVVLNSILIPLISVTGAAIGTVAAEIVVLVMQCRFIREKTGELTAGVPGVRIGLAVLCAVAASFWVLFLPVHSLIRLAISCILFFGTYGVFMVYRKDPVALEMLGLFRKTIRKRIRRGT